MYLFCKIKPRAKSFIIEMTSQIGPISGIVIRKWMMITTEVEIDDNAFDNFGPLSKSARKVFHIIIALSNPIEGFTVIDNELDIYFYDGWAEKCGFVEIGDCLKIAGPANIMFNYDDSHCVALIPKSTSGLATVVSFS